MTVSEQGDWLAEFAKRHNKALQPLYDDRQGRNRWAASVVRTFPGLDVLNVGGGGKRHLQQYLTPEHQVHEVDIVGDCDTKLDLDRAERLPFDDGSFDTCCGFEVLEHLERYHHVCNEMYRVCRSTLLISLPNSAVEILSICRNQRTYTDPFENGVYSKFYGMPLRPPQDRHRWWLTFEDIVRYFVVFEREKSCRVQFIVPNLDLNLKRKVARLLLGNRLFVTLFCSTVWIKIEK